MKKHKSGRASTVLRLACSMAVVSATTVGWCWTFGNGGSSTNRHSMTNNNRYVVFESAASNLVPGDVNGLTDIFRLDTTDGSVVRVNVSTSGTEAVGGASQGPCISADGTKVAFYSDATNLVPNDTNGQTDVFLRDLTAGTTTRVSVDSSGAQATGGRSLQQAISADGSTIVYRSDATNLVSGDTNAKTDIFRYVRATGTTTRVSVSTTGTEANGNCATPAISSDGSTIVFESDATNLVPNDTNGVRDLFLLKVADGTLTRITVSSAGAQSNAASFGVGLDLAGSRVVYQSDATNLVTSDTNARRDIFVYDVGTSTTSMVSITSSSAPGNGNSFTPSLSGDGTKVVFESDATDLVSGDTNGVRDIFVRDLSLGTTTRVSVDSSGTQSNNGSAISSFSADGTKVCFASDATNLVAGDTNGSSDVFVRDLVGGSTQVPVTVSAFTID